MNILYETWMESFGWLNDMAYIGLERVTQEDLLQTIDQYIVGQTYRLVLLMPNLAADVIEYPLGLLFCFSENDKASILSVFDETVSEQREYSLSVSKDVKPSLVLDKVYHMFHLIINDLIRDLYYRFITYRSPDTYYDYVNRYKKKGITIDLDYTLALSGKVLLCADEIAYIEAVPNPPLVNYLRSIEHREPITVYTTREIKYYFITKEWLNKHDIPFTKLTFIKPEGYIYIDDKAVHPDAHIDDFEYE